RRHKHGPCWGGATEAAISPKWLEPAVTWPPDGNWYPVGCVRGSQQPVLHEPKMRQDVIRGQFHEHCLTARQHIAIAKIGQDRRRLPTGPLHALTRRRAPDLRTMVYGRTLRDAGGGPEAAGLTLMGEFELVISGRQLRIPHSAERVLTYLALAERPVARTRLAGVLWEDGSEQSAAKSLRTALWRIR